MAAVDGARVSSEHRQRTAPRMSPSCSLVEARATTLSSSVVLRVKPDL